MLGEASCGILALLAASPGRCSVEYHLQAALDSPAGAGQASQAREEALRVQRTRCAVPPLDGKQLPPDRRVTLEQHVVILAPAVLYAVLN